MPSGAPDATASGTDLFQGGLATDAYWALVRLPRGGNDCFSLVDAQSV